MRYLIFFVIVTILLIIMDIFDEELDVKFFIFKILTGIVATIIFRLFDYKRNKH